MIKRRKLKLWFPISGVMFLGLLGFIGKTSSRYYNQMINDSNIFLAPWNVTINNQKVHTAGKINVNINPVITERTTITKTYKNKIVPGCKGYFDVEINPTGTGVSIDYIIDFKPDSLPGGMRYIQYDILDENKNVVQKVSAFPVDNKLTGTMPIVNGELLGSENILRYRIYFDYVDDDSLNTTAPSVENQNSVMIDVILKQSIS